MVANRRCLVTVAMIRFPGMSMPRDVKDHRDRMVLLNLDQFSQNLNNTDLSAPVLRQRVTHVHLILCQHIEKSVPLIFAKFNKRTEPTFIIAYDGCLFTSTCLVDDFTAPPKY